MKILDRYIVSHIFGFSAIVMLALLAIHTFVTFVAEIDEAGQGGFGYRQLLIYTMWLMPSGLYVLMPIIAMLGTLVGLGTLAAQSELTAMRASGMSLLRIGATALGAGALLGGVCLLMGDWAAPKGQIKAEAMKTEARSGVQAGVGGKPVWLRESEHIFHIQRLLAEDHIAAVEIYTLGDDMNLQAVTLVQEGRYQNDHWRFTGVQRTEFEPYSARVLQLPELDWAGTLSPEVLRLLVLEADALSISGLWRLTQYLKQNKLDASSYALALARKLIAPFTVMVMMFISVPFVFGPLRNVGAGQRLFVGVLIGLAFYVVNEVVTNTGQLYGWNVWVSASAPTLTFALFGLGWLSYAR